MSGGSGPRRSRHPADGGVAAELWSRPPAFGDHATPADGGVVKPSLWSALQRSETTPLPAGGGVAKRYPASGWHIGSLSWGPTDDHLQKENTMPGSTMARKFPFNKTADDV